MSKSKKKHPLTVGGNIYIRTVTYHQIGRVEGIESYDGTSFVVLSNAVWCADSGRFTQAIETGNLNEVELFPRDGLVLVNLGAVSDMCHWNHDLPSVQK